MLAVFQLEKLGGKERDCLAIALLLSSRGHEVVLLTTSKAQDLALPFEVVCFKRSGVLNHLRAKEFSRAVMQYAGAAKSDVLVAFERIPGADVYFAADQPFVAQVGARRWLPRYRTYRALERGVFERAARTRVFFLTQRQREQYVAAYQFDASRGVVLPLILHDERFEATKIDVDRESVRDILGLPRDTIVGIAIALAPMQKGVDRVLLAVANRPDLHLLIVGSTSSWVNRQIRKLDIARRVKVLPYVPDIMRLLKAADFLIHPARLEAAGQVIVEALLARIPVIASGVCGYSTEVEQSGAGVVLPEPFRQEALADAISDVINRLPNLRTAAEAASAEIIQGRGQWLYAVAEQLETAWMKDKLPPGQKDHKAEEARLKEAGILTTPNSP
jgi:UDP-glucose:(heptosyl)LPS alpha-1,3-glucosyltransferase